MKRCSMMKSFNIKIQMFSAKQIAADLGYIEKAFISISDWLPSSATAIATALALEKQQHKRKQSLKYRRKAKARWKSMAEDKQQEQRRRSRELKEARDREKNKWLKEVWEKETAIALRKIKKAEGLCTEDGCLLPSAWPYGLCHGHFEGLMGHVFRPFNSP